MAKKRGTRTRDAVPDILERVSRGESLRKACEANGLDPSGSGFLQRVREDESLAQQYARAHEIGIDCQVGEMQELEQRVLAGEIDPQAFKAALDSRKWRWARQAAKKYGDKLDLNHAGKDGGPLEFLVRVDRDPGA